MLISFKLESIASRLTATAIFRVYLLTPAIFKEMFKRFGSQGCSDYKNLLGVSSIFF